MTTFDLVSFSQPARQEISNGYGQDAAFMPVNAGDFILEKQTNSIHFSHQQGMLQLGVAENGLPVMLDLYNPAPGPLLVAGDGGSGKTAFIQSLALGSDFQDPVRSSLGL